MFALAQKLVIRFQSLKVPKPEKIASDVRKTLQNFRDYLPIIRSLCNPGLDKRHWQLISKVIGDYEIETSTSLKDL